MRNTIKNLETVIDDLDGQIANNLNRDEVVMLERARTEAMATLTTLRYINQ